MKKIWLLILILLMVAGFVFRDQLNLAANRWVAKLSDRLPALEEVVLDLSQQLEVGDTARIQALTPGPLRSLIDNPNAFLTVSGTVDETNRQRQLQGLKSLAANAFLNEAARLKVQDMFDGQYFEHISPAGVAPAELIAGAGYEYIKVGENLALGNYVNDVDLVNGWMNSPPHRENILTSDYTEIGVAVARGMFEGRLTWLAVQEFGRPLSLCPQVDKSLTVRLDIGQAKLKSLDGRIKSILTSLEQNKPEADRASQNEVEQYNQKVDEYNLLVRQHNELGDELQAIADQYNSQVKTFNACLES